MHNNGTYYTDVFPYLNMMQNSQTSLQYGLLSNKLPQLVNHTSRLSFLGDRDVAETGMPEQQHPPQIDVNFLAEDSVLALDSIE